MDRSLYKLKRFTSLQAVYIAIFVNSGSAKLEVELVFKQWFANSTTVWTGFCCGLQRRPAARGFLSFAC